MTIRHFTSSAVVFDEADRVLLVHHNKVGLWLYPGGHIDPNETPGEAAIREVEEETGIRAALLGEPGFTHSLVTGHLPPWTIIEVDVADSNDGPHRHIDFVYVLRALSTELTAQLEEVSGVRWVPIADVAELATPAELPALIDRAVRWAKDRW